LAKLKLPVRPFRNSRSATAVGPVTVVFVPSVAVTSSDVSEQDGAVVSGAAEGAASVVGVDERWPRAWAGVAA
jgi:hypothetical protein